MNWKNSLKYGSNLQIKEIDKVFFNFTVKN